MLHTYIYHCTPKCSLTNPYLLPTECSLFYTILTIESSSSLQNIYWLFFLSEQICFPLAVSFCQCSVQISISKGSPTVRTNGIVLEIIQQNWYSFGNRVVTRKIMLIIFISQTTAKQDLGKSSRGMEAVRQDRQRDRQTVICTLTSASFQMVKLPLQQKLRKPGLTEAQFIWHLNWKSTLQKSLNCL